MMHQLPPRNFSMYLFNFSAAKERVSPIPQPFVLLSSMLAWLVRLRINKIRLVPFVPPFSSLPLKRG